MTARYIVGAFIILIGLGFLFNFDVFRFIFPVIIILIGIAILTGRHRSWDYSHVNSISEDNLKRVLVFSGINAKVESTNFSKGELVAVFGGGDLDLSAVKTKAKEVELDLVAVFGGLRVRIPAEWKVTSEGVGILGGFSVETGKSSGNVLVHLKGAAILGGVEVTS